MEIPELKQTFCINSNSVYFDKILYALDYILSNETPEIKVILLKT